MIQVAIGALLVLAQAGEPTATTLADDLRAAIALPAPKERHTAALAIARRKDATIDNVLSAIDAALQREACPTGPRVVRAPIFAEKAVEDVELAVYVPKSYDPAVPAPLLMAFHGTGATGRGQDEMWRETSEKLGAVIVAPGEAGANEGYAFSMRERDAALGAMRWAQATFAIDPDRIYATGISRGGHLTWDAALRRPDRFAALAPLIGCPRYQLVRGQNNLRFLENLVNVPIRDLQGSKDDPGVLQNLHEAFAKLEGFGARDAKLIEFPDRGHDFDFKAVEWTTFLTAKRVAIPEHLVFQSADLDEARCFWAEITQFTKEVSENPRIDVQAAAWTKLDAAGQRRMVQEQVDKDTARLEITRSPNGHFEVASRGVAKLRLLLARGMYDPKDVIEVTFGGKSKKYKPVPDVKVLLAEFVERLDRSFLPVAAVEIP